MSEKIFIKTEPLELTTDEHIQTVEIHEHDQAIDSSRDSDSDKKRRFITLQEKLDIINRYEKNERTRDISRLTGVNESSLRTIRNNADKIKSSCMFGSNVLTSAGKTYRTRPKLLEETEKLLSIWVEEQLTKPCLTHKKIPFKITLTEKARLIYEELKKKLKKPSKALPFTASNSWYKGFKKRYNLSAYRVLGDTFGTSIFHKQRIMTSLTTANLSNSMVPPESITELNKITTNNELIVQPLFNKNVINQGKIYYFK